MLTIIRLAAADRPVTRSLALPPADADALY